MSAVDVSSTLREELERLSGQSKARAIAVALHDLETGFRFSLQSDRWFHAASTIKVAVLLTVHRAADEGRLRLDDSLHVRNRFFSNGSKQDVIRILLEQRFDSMIPAGLPAHAAVAHKTGEISTASHDMGIVYLPEREPYIAAILTEFDPEQEGRRETVAAISGL